LNHLKIAENKIQHDSTPKNPHSTHKGDEWLILAYDFMGPISQELRINLSVFNLGDINQIQDRSQQY